MDAKQVMKEYELASNSHNFENVKNLIAEDAVYWFSDGSHIGIDEIEKAFVKTFNKIKNEIYTIKNINWIVLEGNYAVCTYNFYWKGQINGKLEEGSGRGTNVLSKRNGKWQIIHEHLSKGK